MQFRMLITDDDASLMALYRALFSCRAELRIDYAADPETCRTLLRRNDYDLVLLDISLTEQNWDGIELLEEIHGDNPSTDVVMMSTMDDEDVVERCQNCGSKAFVSKNQNLALALRQQVEALLTERSTGFQRMVATGSYSSVCAL